MSHIDRYLAIVTRASELDGALPLLPEPHAIRPVEEQPSRLSNRSDVCRGEGGVVAKILVEALDVAEQDSLWGDIVWTEMTASLIRRAAEAEMKAV